MNKKFRNVKRKAFMRNFTRNTEDRYIYIDNAMMSSNQKDLFVSQVNEQLWYVIQEVNAFCANNDLPYINVRRVEDDSDDRLRVMISPNDSEFRANEKRYIDRNNSHIVVMKQISSQRIIQLGNLEGQGRAEIIADDVGSKDAIVDVFLDIAMFNSYSFLKAMGGSERRMFNKKKYEYFISNGFKSYFGIYPEDPPTYISFAFSAHVTHNKIDCLSYVLCWEEFVRKLYPTATNILLKPTEQLKKHVDYDNIDSVYKTDEFWEQFPSGGYLLLRTNRRPNRAARLNKLLYYFGQPTYHIGITKIVPLQQYYSPYCADEYKELNISAFKIIVD